MEPLRGYAVTLTDGRVGGDFSSNDHYRIAAAHGRYTVVAAQWDPQTNRQMDIHCPMATVMAIIEYGDMRHCLGAEYGDMKHCLGTSCTPTRFQRSHHTPPTVLDRSDHKCMHTYS